ncbi:MAG: FliM/FliN family flagellar motor switch protein [Armatimonadetes bacterium]|nr:FliM/FliN family flagellar motor switch protein [Armatimonadota bacterium]
MADEREDAGSREQAVSRMQSQPLAVLRRLSVDVDVRLGGATITIGELMDLQAGSVLALDRSVDEPVELLVGEQVVARGELVSVEGEVGVRIVELIEAPEDEP